MMYMPTSHNMLEAQLRIARHIDEVRHAVAERLIEQSNITQISAVINQTHPGQTDDQITLFDGVGVGLQNLAVAAAVVDLAGKKVAAIAVDL